MADGTDQANAAVQAAFNKMADAKRRGDQAAFTAANSELASAQQKQYDAQKAANAPSQGAPTGTKSSPAATFFGFGR